MQGLPYRVEDSNSKLNLECIIPNYACKGHTNSNKRSKHVFLVE